MADIPNIRAAIKRLGATAKAHQKAIDCRNVSSYRKTRESLRTELESLNVAVAAFQSQEETVSAPTDADIVVLLSSIQEGLRKEGRDFELRNGRLSRRPFSITYDTDSLSLIVKCGGSKIAGISKLEPGLAFKEVRKALRGSVLTPPKKFLLGLIAMARKIAEHSRQDAQSARIEIRLRSMCDIYKSLNKKFTEQWFAAQVAEVKYDVSAELAAKWGMQIDFERYRDRSSPMIEIENAATGSIECVASLFVTYLASGGDSQ